MSRPDCKVCVEINAPKKNKVVNNGVCRKHGATKNLCGYCVAEGAKFPSEVKTDGHCVAHYRKLVDNTYKSCKICIEKNIKPYGWIRSNGVCRKHGGNVTLCNKCKEEGRTPSQARVQGLCGFHLGRIGKCGECIKEDREICKWSVKNGLCTEHLGEDVDYCKICIELEREKPNIAKNKSKQLCNYHCYNIVYCKTCLEEKHESPNVCINNGVCRQHGAIRLVCSICLEYDLPNKKFAKKNGLCRKHGAFIPKCQHCLEENVEKPRNIILEDKCRECSGMFICIIEDCRETIFKSEYCLNHYNDLNPDSLKLCENGCGYVSCKNNKCYKCLEPEDKEKILQKRRDRYKNDINYKLRITLHNRLHQLVKLGYRIKRSSILVGCSYEDLMEHLESKFTEDMTFQNYGLWHIDHIRPCASFDLECVKEQEICFHYTNLQPLWAKDNLKKGAKY